MSENEKELISKINEFIKQWKFKPKNGTTEAVYQLTDIGGLNLTSPVEINMTTYSISYPSDTEIQNNTCLPLIRDGKCYRENLVTLDCYLNLLKTGYQSGNIVLEKTYQVGHNSSGRADVVVLNGQVNHQGKKNPYMIIECKGTKEEYDTAKNKMISDGGQLFSYWAQDQEAEVVVLYVAEFERGNATKREYEALKVNKAIYKNCRSAEALHKSWDGIYDELDIFQTIYNRNVVIKNNKSLADINDTSSKQLHLDILEILRLYSVSDKQNAFMKTINLLIAKVYDEMEGDRDFTITTKNGTVKCHGLEFQYTEHDTDESFQQRVLDLYTKGMKKYLKIKTINHRDGDKDFIRNLKGVDLKDLLLRANELHFIEVYNIDSFEENSKILSGIVKHLQTFRFKNDSRNQLLGDFFENLLNTAVKQEAGQFFTPIPIVQHMVNALPIKSKILQNIENNEKFITPYVIDYSCGSGHFIICAMEAIHKVLEGINSQETKKLTENGYEWAGNTIYGIERDFRLAKTTKINTFLNGDGDANIIHADGLEGFHSNRYIGELKTSKPQMKNEIFDFIVANPPYSVDGFTKSVGELGGSDLFTLYDDFNSKSTEIETLFIERTEQLLKDGGVAAIVLPKSITNTEKYSNMREYLLRHFDIKAILYLGSRTFSDTTTSPIVFYIQKRLKPEFTSDIENSINTKCDNTINSVMNPIAKYLKKVERSCDFSDYVNIFNLTNYKVGTTSAYDVDKHIEAIKSIDDYFNVETTKLDMLMKVELVDNYLLNEKAKIQFFLQNYNVETIVINAPTQTTDSEKQFLGYNFSSNRSKAGIEIYESSALYNNEDMDDPTKLSYLIREFIDSGVYDCSLIPQNVLATTKLHKFNDIVEFNNFSKATSDIPFVQGWQNDMVSINGDYIYLKDLVDFNPKSVTSNTVATKIKIGNIDKNKIKGGTKLSSANKTDRFTTDNDIVIPYLTPARDKFVLINNGLTDTYLLDNALCLIRPKHGLSEPLFNYLTSQQVGKEFFSQVSLKLRGFKESYSRINEKGLCMIKIPVKDLESVMTVDELAHFRSLNLPVKNNLDSPPSFSLKP